MDITYKNKKIRKVCTDANAAEKMYGRKMAEKIQQRIDQITAADSVEMLIEFHIGRCHPLKQNRKGQYAVDLVYEPWFIVPKMVLTLIPCVALFTVIKKINNRHLNILING